MRPGPPVSTRWSDEYVSDNYICTADTFLYVYAKQNQDEIGKKSIKTRTKPKEDTKTCNTS